MTSRDGSPAVVTTRRHGWNPDATRTVVVSLAGQSVEVVYDPEQLIRVAGSEAEMPAWLARTVVRWSLADRPTVWTFVALGRERRYVLLYALKRDLQAAWAVLDAQTIMEAARADAS
jgi:hypothetical protein